MEGLHEKKEKQMRRTIALLATMAMTILVATSAAITTGALSPHKASAHASVGTQKMAIPAYFYATKPEWTQLQNSGQNSGGPVSIAVMNPSSGPGQQQNLDYVNTVNKTKAAGVREFGYVYTDYGDRSQSAVKSDIDKYYEWYNV